MRSAALLGIGVALLGALSWAANYLLIRLGMEQQRPTDVVLVAVLCQAGVVVPVALVAHHSEYGLTATTLLIFTAAGLASGVLGRVCQYESTNRIGASRTSPIVASAGLVSTGLAVLLLGEGVTPSHLLGILLVVVGTAATSWETASQRQSATRREVGVALALPMGAAVLYGIEPVLVKLGLERGTPPLVGLAVMAVAAAVAFFGYRSTVGPVHLSESFSGVGGRYSVGAGVLSAFAYLAYITSLSMAPVVIVLPIFQTTPLLVAGLSLVFMPRHLERVSWRLAASATVVVVGATLVSLAA
ncbi:MAG: DMT family transporter [Halolamina sp.]